MWTASSIAAFLPFALVGGTLLAIIGVLAVLWSAHASVAAAAVTSGAAKAGTAFNVSMAGSAVTVLAASMLAMKAISPVDVGGPTFPLEPLPRPPGHVSTPSSVPCDDCRLQAVGGTAEVVCASEQQTIALEIVGLESAGESVDHVSLCVGIPIMGLRLKSPGWKPWGPIHEHDEALRLGEVTDRDPGPYQTYILELDGDDLPAGIDALKLEFEVLSPGSHQVGLGMAAGPPPPLGEREPFREHVSGVRLVMAEE